MALFQRLLSVNDGSNKKSDSPRLRPMSPPSMRPRWNGLRRRRVIIALAVLTAIYLFVHNLPSDVAPVGQRYNPLYGSMASGHSKGQLGNILRQGQNQYSKGAGSGKVHDEPVRFLHLASTLRTFAGSGFRDNVLFILLNPASAAHLLPLACQMKRNELNSVHFALMGRNDVMPEDIMKANGMLPEDCGITWHDARTDFAMDSSERRILAGIQQGFHYLQRGLAPSVVVIDDDHVRDGSQSTILEHSVQQRGTALLRLPSSTLQFMPWITLLEGSSLARMAKVELEIVVQAYPESSGSLIRLLRSLKNANYAGLNIPRLSIELPPKADPALHSFLTRFKWPPSTAQKAGQLSIRRRIDPRKLTPAESALRIVECFYPASNPSDTHVLLLSPDMELSAGFMHYVMFTILHFRHGRSSNPYSDKLFGISLQLPDAKLDGSKPFLTATGNSFPPFMLSQTPNSRAGLYFGDRWLEFQSFLSQRVVTDPQLAQAGLQPNFIPSHEYPPWTKYALELMLVRGWYMLYPAFAHDPDEQIAMLHQEPSPIPGETAESGDVDSMSDPIPDRAWLLKGDILGEEAATQQTTTRQSQIFPDGFLPTILRGNATQANADLIPSLSVMGLQSSMGETTEWFEAEEIAARFADQFSLKLGGCSSLESRNSAKAGTVDFLFCAPK